MGVRGWWYKINRLISVSAEDLLAVIFLLGVIIEICFGRILFIGFVPALSAWRCGTIAFTTRLTQPGLCIDTSQGFSVEGQIPEKLDTPACADNY